MFVKVADDFHVVPKVMHEGFDRKARACGFGSTLCAQQGYEALAFGPGAGQIVFLAHAYAVFLSGGGSEH